MRTVRFADKRYSAYCSGGEKFRPSPSANSPGGIAEDEALGEGLANHIRRLRDIGLPTGRLIVVFSHTSVKAALPLTQSLCKPSSQCVSTKKCNIQGKNASASRKRRKRRALPLQRPRNPQQVVAKWRFMTLTSGAELGRSTSPVTAFFCAPSRKHPKRHVHKRRLQRYSRVTRSSEHTFGAPGYGPCSQYNRITCPVS